VILSEAVDVEVTVNYFTLVGTAVDGVTGNDRIDYQPITGTLTFAPGETRKEVEIRILGDTPVNYGGNANFEIFARDTAYQNWDKGDDIDFNGSLSYGDLGYRVDQFFNDGSTGFQATGLTSDENFFVLISNPVNSEISQESDQEKDRLLTDLEEFLGPDFVNSSSYQKVVETLNDLEAQDTSWAYATGTIYDEGKAPVLAIRGTQPDQLKTDVWDDANPNGIGYGQFTANRGAVNQWLQEASQPEDNLSLKPHITGHSLGGALTQWVAADYSSQGALGNIVTFNAPGISTSAANSFRGAEKVTHYITSIDIVSMAGFRYISGQYVLSNQLLVPSSFPNPVDAHLHPVIIPKVESSGLTKPANLKIDTVGGTNALSSPFFTYLPDPDYFAIQLIVASVPIIGPYLANQLTFRSTTELNRQAIGELLYGIGLENIEFAIEKLTAAVNAAKQWGQDAWNAITGWGENAWGAVSNWTVTAWNATTTWVSQAWNATTTWTSDAWNATKQWTSDAWNATKQWTSDAWNATTTWTSDAWNTTTKWTSDAWNATTKWVSDLWPFSSSSDFLSVTAFNEMNSDSINLQQTLINNPWQAIAQWTPEAWEATTHWSDAAWQATTAWTPEVWQATTVWTSEVWQATTAWTDEIWQATTQLDSTTGDEILFGTIGNDNLSGNAGKDILDGLAGNDVLDGGEGNDIIKGSAGNDSLTGGTGSDSFVFESPTEGIDTIEDFDSSEGDRIVISATGFGGGLIPDAVLAESQFVLGTTAVDSDDRFIYDPATGNLFFDPDGNGAAPQQQIAILTGAPNLSAGDIFISGNSTTPSIKITAPSTNVSDTKVTIEWNAFDADSEATISLFYDTDNQGFDGVLIADRLAETDGQGSFVWNTENIPLKDYFIYAQISDETHSPVFSYAKGQVLLKPLVEADLSVTKTPSVTSVELGETFTYTIQVTNNGSVTAQGITITEILAEPVTFVSASLTPSQQSDNAFTFDIGELPSGESQIIEVTAIAPTLLTGTIISNTSVLSETNDPNLTNNVALLATEVTAPALPDLVVTRTDSSGGVNINSPYSYSLTVTNNGSATATGVILTEQLPSTVDVISATANVPGLQRNLVDLIKFPLNAGERVTLDIDARTLGSSLDSVLRLFDSTGIQLRVSDDNPAPNEPFSRDSYIDFTASVSGTYYVGVSGYSNFSYNPFIDGSGASSSSSGNYTLEIKVGSGGSTNQVVLGEPNNTIPQAVDSGLSSANPGIFVAFGSIRTDSEPITNPISINLGDLDIGASVTVDLTVSSIAAGNLNSTTIVTSNELDANPLDNLIAGTQVVSSETPTEIDLELTQTVNNSNPAIGDEITLTLTLTNIGPGIASNIQVTNVLPSELAFISVFAEQGTYDSNTGIWNVGNMRDNLSRTLTITAQVNGGQSLTNTAQVTAVFEADLDSIPNNNDPTEDDQASVLIDVQNVAPIVQGNKTLTVLEDASSTSLNISTPTDGNGDSLTLTVETIPDGTKGQIFLGNNLVNTGDLLTPQQLTSLVFVPSANANGAAGTFSYTVRDGQGGTASQTITLAITSVNDAPVAQDDTATTSQNTPITLAVLANDSDIEDDSISLTSFNPTSSQGGTVSRDENGTPSNLTDDKLLYTPATGFIGIDSFTYTVSDGTDSDTATVTITVTSTNQPPQAVNDVAKGTQNTPLIIPFATLLSNDTDPDSGDILNLTGVSNPSNGSVKLNGSNVIFTPLAGFIGQASFDYSISDNQGETSTASVNIAVNPFLGSQGRDTLIGKNLDDILMGGLGADNLTGNQGHDQFVYQSIRDAGDVIKDFEVGIDRIVFTALLNSLGYGGSNPIADGYLNFGSRRNDTVILFDEDGSGLSKRALPFITVENLALTAMQNPNNFIF